MSETDEQFVERLFNEWGEWAGSPANARLFALARRGAAVQWRPIEEAPKDGRSILITGGSFGWGCDAEDCDASPCDWVATAQWFREGWQGGSSGGHDEHFWYAPNHWMPLPPPAAGGQR